MTGYYVHRCAGLCHTSAVVPLPHLHTACPQLGKHCPARAQRPLWARTPVSFRCPRPWGPHPDHQPAQIEVTCGLQLGPLVRDAPWAHRPDSQSSVCRERGTIPTDDGLGPFLPAFSLPGAFLPWPDHLTVSTPPARRAAAARHSWWR